METPSRRVGTTLARLSLEDTARSSLTGLLVRDVRGWLMVPVVMVSPEARANAIRWVVPA